MHEYLFRKHQEKISFHWVYLKAARKTFKTAEHAKSMAAKLGDILKPMIKQSIHGLTEKLTICLKLT